MRGGGDHWRREKKRKRKEKKWKRRFGKKKGRSRRKNYERWRDTSHTGSSANLIFSLSLYLIECSHDGRGGVKGNVANTLFAAEDYNSLHRLIRPPARHPISIVMVSPIAQVPPKSAKQRDERNLFFQRVKISKIEKIVIFFSHAQLCAQAVRAQMKRAKAI